MGEQDLIELEADFINHAEHGPQFRKLLMLVEEWRQRFGQSIDFHGAYIADCDLIGGTCLGVAAHSLQSVEFDLCIVDAASRSEEHTSELQSLMRISYAFFCLNKK